MDPRTCQAVAVPKRAVARGEAEALCEKEVELEEFVVGKRFRYLRVSHWTLVVFRHVRMIVHCAIT